MERLKYSWLSKPNFKTSIYLRSPFLRVDTTFSDRFEVIPSSFPLSFLPVGPGDVLDSVQRRFTTWVEGVDRSFPKFDLWTPWGIDSYERKIQSRRLIYPRVCDLSSFPWEDSGSFGSCTHQCIRQTFFRTEKWVFDLLLLLTYTGTPSSMFTCLSTRSWPTYFVPTYLLHRVRSSPTLVWDLDGHDGSFGGWRISFSNSWRRGSHEAARTYDRYLQVTRKCGSMCRWQAWASLGNLGGCRMCTGRYLWCGLRVLWFCSSSPVRVLTSTTTYRYLLVLSVSFSAVASMKSINRQ